MAIVSPAAGVFSPGKFPASQPPMSVPSGFTTDPPYGPLHNSGMPNPFFYAEFEDDFLPFISANYTQAPAASAAALAGDGGLITTTGTLQAATASFTLPTTGNNPPVTAASAKKMFYLARLRLDNITTAAFMAGLAASGVTFAGTVPATDGLFFYKAAGGTAIQIVSVATAANSPSGTAFTNTITIPADAIAQAFLANAQNFDIAFEFDRVQNLFIYLGYQLVGWLPQSGTDGTKLDGTPWLPVRGKVAANYNWLSQATGMAGNVATPRMYSTANLTPTIGVSGGTATVDFHCVQKER